MESFKRTGLRRLKTFELKPDFELIVKFTLIRLDFNSDLFLANKIIIARIKCPWPVTSTTRIRRTSFWRPTTRSTCRLASPSSLSARLTASRRSRRTVRSRLMTCKASCQIVPQQWATEWNGITLAKTVSDSAKYWTVTHIVETPGQLICTDWLFSTL